jgi:hypothetical protein
MTKTPLWLFGGLTPRGKVDRLQRSGRPLAIVTALGASGALLATARHVWALGPGGSPSLTPSVRGGIRSRSAVVQKLSAFLLWEWMPRPSSTAVRWRNLCLQISGNSPSPARYHGLAHRIEPAHDGGGAYIAAFSTAAAGSRQKRSQPHGHAGAPRSEAAADRADASNDAAPAPRITGREERRH